MANVKISQLPSTSVPQGAGLIPIVQDGTTYSTTATDLVALAAGGVTEFNTRTGDVTLLSGDVIGALGYTPVSPTDLANDLADYVPEARELTINGVTQDLSANRTFTVATGAATYPFTGSSINAGEPVVINSDGTISSAVVSSDPLPTVNATTKGIQDTTLFNNSMAYGAARSIVSPHDPSLKAYTYIDQGSGNSLFVACTQNNDREINFPLPTVLSLGGSVTGCAIQFDPFNPDLLLVLYNQGNNIYGQYININYTYNNNSVPRLSTLGSFFYIGNNWNYFDFQFSVKYPNTIVAQYSDGNSSNLPYVVSAFITQMGPNSFTSNIGTSYSLYASGYFGSQSGIQKLSRLEGTDTFMAYFNPYDSPLNGQINQVVLFKIDPAYSDFNTYPSLVLGAAQIMVDYTNPTYQYAGVVGAIFLSATKIAYTLKEGMGSNYYTVIGSISDVTVNSIGAPNQFASAYSLTSASTSVYALPINGEQYIAFVGVPTVGGDSGNIVCGIGKVTGITIAFTDAGVLAYNNVGVDMVGIGLFQGSGMVTLSPSSVLPGVVNVCLNWWTNTSGAYMYFKTSTIKYINKVFSNKNLLGIAQNTAPTPSGTVQVLPFGSIDDNQGSLVTGTSYYLQDNGVITTNVTPTLLGTALSGALIKTANYPTI